jgi:Ca2+-binding EF-hand superfamily protein
MLAALATIATIAIVAIVAIVGAATPLGAQDKLLRTPFARFDRNGDGVITAEEFPGDPGLYKAMDQDKDGKVTFDEYKVSAFARRYLAAMRVDRDEPRKRVSLADLARRRLENLARFDKNRDGKVTRAEWTGAPDAFTSLDVDGNGVIDKKDRHKAKAEAEVLAQSLDAVPELRGKLPGGDALLTSFDKDKDTQISRREAAKSPLEPAFGYADRNGDGFLDRGELAGLISAVNAAIDQRNLGYAKPKAPIIPFKTWDKDKDGRVDVKEWVEQKYLFKKIDRNRDAAVTEEELLRYKRAFEGDDFLQKFDLNGDGRVTPAEFGGSRAAFDRADRNRDGVISARDR